MSVVASFEERFLDGVVPEVPGKPESWKHDVEDLLVILLGKFFLTWNLIVDYDIIVAD